MMAGSDVSISCNYYLFDVPPSTMETFCKLMDCSDGDLGWRGLAEHISTDWMEFRKIERYAEQGKSRTRELLWSWAHKNKTVGDLLTVLYEMGHERAIHLFTNQGAGLVCVHGSDHRYAGLKNHTFETCGVPTLEYVARGVSLSPQKEKSPLPPVSFNTIKDVTKNFHQDFLIGEGQFLDVYKAEIKSQMCVVKVLRKEKQLRDQKLWELFHSQWKDLPRFKHPNILELLGYSSTYEATCLVYPYLSNGSLFNRIQCIGKSDPLLWKVRYNILQGVAKAIQYLHTMKPSPVICGNITSKNILLDQHFQPKLSDFAMVHLRSYLINHIYTIKMDHATLKFLGYLPVEYIRRGNLSSKTDVYSYGVIMMEVLTGHQAVLKGPENIFLRELLWELTEKNGVESLVPILDDKCDSWPEATAHRLLSLSMACTSSRVKQRPTMAEVLEAIGNSKNSQYSENDPKSLKSVPPSQCPSPTSLNLCNVPEESDESQDYPIRLLQKKKLTETPCECSQSEVTFLGTPRHPSHSEFMLLPESNSHKPVECSCSTETESLTSCENCIASGYGHSNIIES
ncbi:interleukin-1 receptor-associated kinase 3 [Pelobates fuscus]|uniref:interleukin-1 receptor-associated kinase 3 n=1 Tax=Pelobates fuscus TaxID=191477 RepID=UPI002FE4D322